MLEITKLFTRYFNENPHIIKCWDCRDKGYIVKETEIDFWDWIANRPHPSFCWMTKIWHQWRKDGTVPCDCNDFPTIKEDRR